MTAFALGIDVGTTSVKALALAPDGVVLGRASSDHGIASRAGVVEADPSAWWSSTCRAVGELAAQLGTLADVRVVGLSGNMSSVVVLDRERRPLLPAVLLPDSRGAAELAALPADLAERITSARHNEPGSVFALSTLLWLPPELLDRASAWLAAKDYLRLLLTGTVGAEITDAYNSLLVSASTRDWDTVLIAELGLPAHVFPVLQGSSDVVGEVTADAADALGLPAGVPVVAGLADMAAALYGLGASDGLHVSLGTSVTTITPIPAAGFDASWTGRLTYHPLPDPSRAYVLGSLITGGLAVNWLRSRFEVDLTSVPLDPLSVDDPLVFVPLLAGAGTPEFDPAIRGSMLGLQPSTTGADLARALFEAAGCELASVVDLLGVDRVGKVVLTGGGTRLSGLVAAIAGVLGRTVHVVDEPDVSAVGAASLAWQGIGVSSASRPIAATEVPAASVERWTARRARYRRARVLTDPYYHAGAATP